MFKLDANKALLTGVPFVESPNCDELPAGCTPELIVVHGISLPPGEFGGPWIEQLFTNCLPPDRHPYFAEIADLKVSAHLLVRRDGSVVQYVPLNRRAWHAGESSFAGRERCNDFSIGIELEGEDHTPYEEAQYRTLAELIVSLRAELPGLAGAEVVGHCDIAPGRKTDPGEAFNWQYLDDLLNSATRTDGEGTI